MRPVWEMLLILALIVSIGLLVSRSVTETRAQQDQLEAKIQELLQREEVALADFIEALGEPDGLSVVTCDGTKCVRAFWDLSYAFRECWKRLIVVLHEEKKRVFFAETKELVVIQKTPEETRCAQVPE